MSTLVIRNVDPVVHGQLKDRAQIAGRSMEEEVRILLRQHVADTAPKPEQNWVAAIRALFEPLGGVELEPPAREAGRAPPDFSGPEWDHLNRS